MSNGILLYIDPGTGAMLFTTILGIITTAAFAFKKLFIKLKFYVSGGRSGGEANSEKLPIVIFSDSKRYWNVFKSICDVFESRGLECNYWTLSSDDPALDEKYEHVKCQFIGEGNHGYAKLNMMNAYVCLSTTPGLDVYQWHRSKNTDWYVHIPHAIGGSTMYRMFGLDFYDAVLLTGPRQSEGIREIEKVRKLPEKEVAIVGATFLDCIEERIKQVEAIEKKKDNPLVLLAPSWGPSSILNKFGDEFLEALQKTGYEIVVRPHPQSRISEKDLIDRLELKFPESDKWHWNYDNDNFYALMNSDIMITDFSGVIFEYSFVFEKPVIYTDTEIDFSPYDACWLDSIPWNIDLLPLVGRKITKDDIPNIKTIVDATIEDDSIQVGREKAKTSGWMYTGEAAERTVDYLIGKLETLKKGEYPNA